MAADQKGAAADSAWLVFFDESAVSLIPPVRRTSSPRGHNPVLRHRFGWKQASMATALGYLGRWWPIHRRLGRVCLWAAWTTSLSSLGVAAFFDISLAAKTAFAGVSLLGFATTTVAFSRIRQGKILQHREWMIRSYSLAFSL